MFGVFLKDSKIRLCEAEEQGEGGHQITFKKQYAPHSTSLPPLLFTFEYTVWVCVIDSSGGCREMMRAVIKHLMYQGLLGSRIIDAGELAVLLACDSCDSDIRYLGHCSLKGPTPSVDKKWGKNVFFPLYFSI